MNCLPIQTLPAKVTAGLSFQVGFCNPSYPAPDWQATAYLRGTASVDLVATSDSAGDHQFAVPALATKVWTPGSYWYVIRVALGTDVHQVESGVLEVLPDFMELPAGYDGRSENEKALAAVDAVLARRATIDQERYRINNRELYRTPIADLLKLRGYYSTLVQREKAKKAGRSSSFGRQINVRFS